MEYLLALVPALAWGNVGIAQNKAGGKPTQATIGSMTGFLIFSLIILAFNRQLLSGMAFFAGALSGFCLALANIGQFDGMNKMGVSTAVPLVAAQQLMINTLLGAFLFHNWTTTDQWLFGILAIVLVIIGSQLTNYKEDKSAGSAQKKSGMFGVVIAGIFGGMYAFIPNAYKYYWHVQGGSSFSYAMMLPQAIGGIIGAILLFAILEKKNPFKQFANIYIWRNTFVGVLWAVGNLCLLIVSTGKIGLATAFTFSQLNLVVASVEGILVIHEKKTHKETISLSFGNVFVIAGAVITALI